MDDDEGRAAMTMALLEVADIELRGCDTMAPVIALGQREGGRLTAYAHLKPLPGASGPFPFDITPAQRAFHQDGVDLFGLCYGVWRDRNDSLIAQPQGFPGRQAGVIAVIGRRGSVAATFYQIDWQDGAFAGFGSAVKLATAPVGDLLADPADGVVISMETWKGEHNT
jgi:hypothetical protein